jgi:multicomponent Na+:H+ antiporter subunit B
MSTPRLRDSPILSVSLRALFPFVVLFSFQLFSYGANSPGGGFQAGVVFGTIVVVLDLLWDRRIYADRFYEAMELAGLALLFGLFAAGGLRTGHPFGGFYGWTGRGLLFSNVFFWLLNLAIFFEVAGSIVLIFRHFLDEGHASEVA